MNAAEDRELRGGQPLPDGSTGGGARDHGTLPADESVHDDASMARGRELAVHMDEHCYHPVVVFGAHGAGKSTLLASLLAYLTRAGSHGIGVRADAGAPGDALRSDATARELHASVKQFLDGETPSPTRAARAAFVPVVLESHATPETRFAFLEGSEIAADPNGSHCTRRLAPELSTFLREYPGSISVLHVAPCTLGDTWTDDAGSRSTEDAARRRGADDKLAAAIDAYRAVRVQQHRDAHLFLLTKWDAHARPGPPWSSFASPTIAEVASVARGFYPRSFATFANLATGGASRQVQVMQYCAAIISGRSVVRPGAELQQQIDRCPRVLWSWLHANANNGAAMGKPLFETHPSAGARLLQRADRGVARLLRILGV